MPPCVQIANLTKCYGSVVAVGGLSLEIDTGEVFGLLGPNGAGKTTTLHMLTGLVPPTSGTVSIFGKDLRKNFLEVMPRVGVLVESPSFYNHLSARRNLLLLAKFSAREIVIDRALDLVGLLPAARRKVGAYSRGMRQRLGLAQALLTEPELLVLDEPTSGLDVEGAQEFLKLLRLLAEEARVTVVVSSHRLHEVELLCDRVAIINKSRLLTCERTEHLLSHDLKNIEVILDAPEAAAKRLLEQPWVEAVEVQYGRIHVKLGDATVHQLNAFLVGAGYMISGLIPRRRTLQDFFLKVLNS
jgi:ABC-type multidrug transport system ATPase subunit